MGIWGLAFDMSGGQRGAKRASGQQAMLGVDECLPGLEKDPSV
jgi:hypothetical protein